MSDVAVAIIVASVFVSWSLDRIAEAIEKNKEASNDSKPPFSLLIISLLTKFLQSRKLRLYRIFRI